MIHLTEKKSVEAKRLDNSLVAAFHRATPPLIWRFDLERNHSFTLALQGDDGEWELGMTSPKGEFHPVAHFNSRDDAEEAFFRVEQVLAKTPLTTGDKILRVLAVVAILSFVAFIAFYGIRQKHTGQMISYEAPLLGHIDSPKIESGVPLTADEVLRPPTP